MTDPESPAKAKSARARGKSQPRTFEAALARLEEIVATLESGEESLDASVRLFEEAMGLAQFCRKKLDVAQGRIERLVEKAGGPAAVEPDQEDED
jgi:exodeoxyribonuclease VII small subunit